MRRTFRRAVRFSVATIAIVLAVAAAILAAPVTHGPLLRYAAGLASTREVAIKIGSLQGSLWSDARIEWMTLSDGQGVWLRLENVAVGWRPSALFAGRVHVERLHVGHARLVRRPAAVTSVSTSQSNSSSLSMAFALDDARMEQLQIDEPVAGVPALLHVTAAASARGLDQPAQAEVSVTRIDATPGELFATGSFVPASRQLAFQLRATEPRNGLMVALLDVPGRPALRIDAEGRGTMQDWYGELTATAEDVAGVRGRFRLRDEAGGQVFSGDLSGRLSGLLPHAVRGLFAGNTVLALGGRVARETSIEDFHATLRSDALQTTARGSGDFARSFVAGSIDVRIGRADGEPVSLLDGTAPYRVRTAQAALALQPARRNRRVQLDVRAGGIETPHAGIGGLELQLHARQAEPEGAAWHKFEQMRIDVRTSRVEVRDPALADVLGSQQMVAAQGEASLDHANFTAIDAVVEAGRLSGSGKIGAGAVAASWRFDIEDLVRASKLLGRPVAGRLTGTGTVEARPGQGPSKIETRLQLDDARFGIAALDAVVGGRTEARALVHAHSDGRLVIEGAEITGAHLNAKARGAYGGSQSQIEFSAAATMAAPSAAGFSGHLQFHGNLEEDAGRLGGKVEMSADGATWRGVAARLNAKGTLSGSLASPSALIQLDTSLATIKGGGQLGVSVDPQAGARLSGVDLEFGGNRIRGSLDLTDAVDPAMLLTADLRNLSAFSGLLGQPLSGRGAVTIAAAPRTGHAGLKLAAALSNLSLAGSSIERIDITGQAATVWSAPKGSARVMSSGLAFGSVSVDTASLDMISEGRRAAMTVSARGPDLAADAAATVESGAGATNFVVSRLRAHVGTTAIALHDAARVTISANGAQIAPAKIGIDKGTLSLAGGIGRDLRLTAELRGIPAAAADAFAAGHGLLGTIDGRVTVRGPPDDATADYDLRWTGAGTVRLAGAGLPSVAVGATGTWNGGDLRTTATISGERQLALRLSGRISPDRRDALDMSVEGGVPLGLALAPLAERGTRGSGQVRVRLAATGPLDRPRLDGRVTVTEGTLEDPQSGLQVAGLRLDGSLAGDEIDIASLEATSGQNGRISGRGRIELHPDKGLPADLRLAAANLRFDDRKMLAGTIDVEATVSGSLLTTPHIAGTVTIGRLDVTIPESLPGSLTDLEIRHVGLTREARAELGLPEPRADDAVDGVLEAGLDVQVVSDGKIFVRGHGVDAVLSGDVRVTGRSSSPVTTGTFKLERGRMTLVGRRLEFSRGTVGFHGSLMPRLDFEASSQTGGAVITAHLSGPADNPRIRFESIPELPEDEALARLLFNKSLSKLSPVQIALLASEVDRLGGLTSGSGVMDQLRKSIGVDVFDVTTDKKGNAAVAAGSYLNDKVYVGVEQSVGSGDNRVVIDLDITKNVKGRAEAGSDGRSKIGVGVEWNY